VRLLIALLACSATAAAQAAPRPPESLCAQAITSAEQANAVPDKLMTAIGYVESGRRDPRTGAYVSWPWTVDAAGQSRFFDTAQQAMSAVEALRQQGVQSIDVGCMQINLQQHPDAFGTLASAFDPVSNARYAARFLVALHETTGTWPEAAARYHSATPAFAVPYRAKVLALWPGGAAKPALRETAPHDALAAAWAATLAP
jgi:hypothetical protein